MKLNRAILSLSFVALIVSVSAYAGDDEHKRGKYSRFNQGDDGHAWHQHKRHGDHDDDRVEAQLGPRPFYLVNDMDPGKLKKALKQ